MKKIILSVSIISILAIVIVLLNILGSKTISNEVVAQIPPTVTPCRPPFGNKGNPCEQKTPTKEEIEERNKRAKEWEEKKKKLLTADFPLTNETSIDVDGNGKADKILYQIKPWKDEFEGLLKITSAENEILWEHEFFMSSRDLTKFLVEVLDYDSVTDWVKSVFNKEAAYSFKAEKIKIEAAKLSDDQIDYAAKLYRIESQKLKTEILMQKTNQVYTYRAEWREDLMQIVYVRSLKKFACFSRGY